jgi:hypothetical protein
MNPFGAVLPVGKFNKLGALPSFLRPLIIPSHMLSLQG